MIDIGYDIDNINRNCFIDDIINHKMRIIQFHRATYRGFHGHKFLWDMFKKLKHKHVFGHIDTEDTVLEYYDKRAEWLLPEIEEAILVSI